MSNNKTNIAMNNEETIIMQPKGAENTTTQNVNNTAETVKDEVKETTKNGSSAKRVAATAAAGVFGGSVGGAGSVTAANMMNAEEPEVQPEEAQATEVKPTPVAEPKEEEIPVTVDETQEPDYTNNNNADPVVSNPQSGAQQTSDDAAPEVQVLGVYQNESGQEMAILTNGEEVAAVLDANGDGEVNLLGVDSNHNGQFEEGEIVDVSDQHVSMSQYEEAYVAQQQMEAEQHETFAYNASDEADYNNNAEMYYDA